MKNVYDDLSSLDLGIHEARESASLETDVFAQRYALAVMVQATTGLDSQSKVPLQHYRDLPLQPQFCMCSFPGCGSVLVGFKK